MFEKTDLIIAIDKADQNTAIKLYKEGNRIPNSPHAYDYSQLFDNLIRIRAHELINLMVENGEIENDVYMLDSIENSIFSKLIRVKNFDDSFLEFFKKFIEGSQNINDEVAGQSLISYAIESGADPKILQTLIDAGCNTHFKNQAEDNLINISIKKYGISSSNLISYIQIFSNEGVDINEKNKVGKTALHHAVESNKPQILDILLQNGANPNEQDAEGNSPFHIAVAHKLDLDTYNQLAEYDSMDFEQTNNRGEKAFHEYLRILDGYSSENPELLLKLIEDGANLNSTSPFYNKEVSAWDWIAQKKAVLFEKVINTIQPEINEQDDLGNTLLHKVVSQHSNNDQNTAKETYRKVKFLLDRGASATLLNNDERSAIMIASEDNLKAKTVEILLIAQQKEK